MNTSIYLRRVAKSFLYFLVIFTIIFLLIYFFSDKKTSDTNFFDLMLPKHNRLPLAGFVIVFSFIYPLLTYVKKTIYLNNDFEQERESIMKVFQNTGYELIKDENKKLFFRPKNKISRFMRMMEDTVELNYSDNPLVISGMRKEIYRIVKHIEYFTIKHDEQN